MYIVNCKLKIVNVKAYSEAAEHFLTTLNFQVTFRFFAISEHFVQIAFSSFMFETKCFADSPDCYGDCDRSDLVRQQVEVLRGMRVEQQCRTRCSF